MSPNKYYYSAGEKDGKLKALKIVLCILLAVVIVAGGVYTFIYAKNLEKEHTVSGETAETKIYNVNVLLCIEDEDNEDIAPQFLLVGFDSEAAAITVSEIPTSQKLVGEERTDTAINLFEYGSARYLRDAVVNHYSIPVQRFIRMSLSEVETVVDKLGGVDYNIKKQMQYKNKEGNLVTNLVKGKQKLNGNQYCQFLRYDDWRTVAEKREKHEDLFITLINQYSASLDSEMILNIYKKISNYIETDISIVEMNDFSLQFGVFAKAETPAISADIDYSDDETAGIDIQKFYK